MRTTRLDRAADAAYAALDAIGGGPIDAQASRVLQVRLAKTKAHGEDTYPAVMSADNTYPFLFVDSRFTEAQGAQALTTYDRQTDADKFVRNLCKGALGYIPESEIIPIFWLRGRWWTYYARVGSRRCKALAKGAVAKSDVTFAVDNVVALDGGASPTANSAGELTVSNWAKWEAKDNAQCSIEWDEDQSAWRFYQGACKADQ